MCERGSEIVEKELFMEWSLAIFQPIEDQEIEK